MPQKWAFFAIGVMAGIIGLLSFALLLQARTPSADAATQDNNPAAGIVVATGGSQQNMNDICWILFKRLAPKKAGGDATTTEGVMHKDEYLTLGCYRVTDNGKRMTFVGMRNISWDLDLIEYQNEKPTVMEIIKALREEEKKKKDNK
jgi:hypothetical protein